MYYIGLVSPTLALLYDLEKQKGNANRATLAVARENWLPAVPRGQTHFLVLGREACQVSPLNRLGAGTQAPDAPVDKFRDWQENTNSILLGSPT
jgi:hypothetical protein